MAWSPTDRGHKNCVSISICVIHKMKWSTSKMYSFINAMPLSKHCTVWQLWMILIRTVEERNWGWKYIHGGESFIMSFFKYICVIEIKCFLLHAAIWENSCLTCCLCHLKYDRNCWARSLTFLYLCMFSILINCSVKIIAQQQWLSEHY